SFNPIHNGHLIVARAAAEQLGVQRVVLLPSAHPPHKPSQDLAPAADRLEMCRLAVAGDGLFEICDWELRQPGPNYTIHTIEHFRAAAHGDRESSSPHAGRPSPSPASADAGDWRPYWLIGMDSLRELPTWHRIGELLDLCTFVT